MLYSGIPIEKKTRSAFGVGIMMSKSATTAWRNSGAEWEAINERIIRLRIKCEPIPINMIVIYAPINSTNKHITEVSEEFYLQLQTILDKIPQSEICIIMGDFNARTGQEQHQTMPKTVGPHTTDVKNENGVRLTDFCQTNNLIISNTFFKHKCAHQKFWMHPGTKIWHTLDYTLINKNFRSTIEDVRFYRRAAGGIETDHHLMRSKLKLHLRSRNKITQTNQQMKIDRSKLQDDLILKMYQKELVTTYEESNQSSLDVNNKYIEFVKYVRQATQKHLTKKADKNKKRKEWMTDEIMNKVDEKSAAYVKWQNHRGTADEDKYKGKYTVLRKVVKNMINERQIEYWNKVSSEIETAITQHDPATAYAIIRRFKSGKQDVQNMSVKKKSAVGTHTIDSISIPNISTLEIQRQDKIPTLEEIQLALSQMKSKKAPGNDGIIVDILKAGGTPGLIWLKELSVEIWENERIPENWSSAILIPLFKNKGDKTSCDNYRGICLLNV
ncbi:unnamed protein product, partial [Rotaria magnacalcarata]